MTIQGRRGVSVLVGAMLMFGTNAAQTVRPDHEVLDEFAHAIADYVAVRAHAVSGLPVLDSSHDMGEIRRVVELRAVAIARARAAARGGELFTPDLARIIRARLKRGLEERGLSSLAALHIIDDEVGEDEPVLIVNGPFPWDFGSGMLPGMLTMLPPLAEGLEYRFVHTSLVIVDVDVDLVVDVLRDALVVTFPA